MHMACVQVDFVQALLAEFPKSPILVLYHQNQIKCCTEIPATRSVFFLLVRMVTISAL
jgi:hypothetical protein